MVRPYTVEQPFRFWCQKILPLVYDDSLSYYELLNKVVDYLNKNVDNVNALGEAFNNLQKYVQDYFTNLDVQQEIDAKLDAMVEDGTMDELIQPLVGDAVSEWLEDNVTPTGSAVVVDASLTISGAAADAKVTGDEISDLKSDLNYNHAAEPGYVLRATNTGHGNEWAMVGTPTDAQAETAINAWLDAHPEATTTVQDWSLTYKKLVKGTLEFVTPEMYGAKGDGVTDDTESVQAAINSGKTVVFSKSNYLITRPIIIDEYTTLVGSSAGWNNGGTVFTAGSTFVGEYMFDISHDTTDVCRSVNISDVNLNCNGVTGGIRAIHLYDGSVLKNINITLVEANSYGLSFDYHGHISQTVILENVICVADTSILRSNLKALIKLERLQECTLINVKSFSNNSASFEILGCESLTMIACATYDYTNEGKAFVVRNYVVEGYGGDFSHNITMIGCLNEGNAGGLDIDLKAQRLTGTFAEYTAGAVITQGSASGIINLGGTSNAITVFPISGSFENGICSAGEISDVATLYGDGIRVINYQPKIHSRYSAVAIKGISNSIIEVNKTIGYSTGVEYALSENYGTEIIVSTDDTHSVTTDYTSSVVPKSPIVLFARASGKVIYGFPASVFDGLTIIIYGTKALYDCRVNLPVESIYNDTKALSFNYFTKAVLKVVCGKFVVVECDGDVLDRTNDSFIWKRPMDIITLVNQTTNATGYVTNKHYINEGAQSNYTINMNAIFVGKKITVTSVNTYPITVNISNGGTLPDGTTTSVDVGAGETKTFEVFATNIVNVI